MILDTPIFTSNLFNITALHSAIEYQWDEKFVFDGERHDFWEAVFVISGEVECTEDDKVYHLQKDNMVFHAPMEFHKIRSAAQTSPHLFIISFSVNGHMPEIISEGVFTLSHDETVRYSEIFKSIYKMCTDGDASNLRSQTAVMSLAAFLFELALHSDAESSFSELSSAKMYHNAISAMQNGIYDNLNLGQIADDCHISISYLKKIFNGYAGQSPKRYYDEMRCNEAVRLLKKGISVAEVSEKMSFSSPNYFSTFIKKNTGLSPAKHRLVHNDIKVL